MSPALEDDTDANLRYQGSVDNAGNGLVHATAPSFTSTANGNMAWSVGSRPTHPPMAPRSQVDESQRREGTSQKGFSADANVLQNRQAVSDMMSTSVLEVSDGNPGYTLHAPQTSQAAIRSRESSESYHSEQPEGDIYW